MRKANIWVLIMDGVTARICSSGDGSTILVAANGYDGTLSWETLRNNRPAACQAWYRSNTINLSGSPATDFVGYLAQLLNEAAHEQAYEGLVVIAAPEIARRLERALSAGASALLMGEIIRDIRRIAVPDHDGSQEFCN